MRFNADGLTLWYGTEDAPAATYGEVLVPGKEITIGVSPANPGNRVVVTYRVDQGTPSTLAAILKQTDYRRNRQYFGVTFGDLPGGSRVEYLPVLMCAGRQAPDVKTRATLPSSFRVEAAKTRRQPTEHGAQERTSVQSSFQSGFQSPVSQEFRYPFSMDYIGTITRQTQSPTIIGNTPEGYLIVLPTEKLTLSGPKINASSPNLGGSRITVRLDGIGIPAVRAVMTTPDGATIMTEYSGIVELGKEPERNFPDHIPRTAKVRTAPTFLTAHPDYLWLNRLQCVGVGILDLEERQTTYDVFAVGAGNAVNSVLSSVSVARMPTSFLRRDSAAVAGRFAYNLEYLATVSMQLKSSPVVVGKTPDGLKVVWSFHDGTVTGPKLNGNFVHIGGDWMTIRPDGMGIPGIRAVLTTTDGAQIGTEFSGMFDLGEEGYDNFMQGKWPRKPLLRSTPRFLTAHPDYLWINRLQCLGIGDVNMEKLIVNYDLYAIE